MRPLTPPLREPLLRLRQAWEGSPLPGFLRWWGSELRGLLPARWQVALGEGEAWYLIAPTGEGWTLRAAGSPVASAAWTDAEAGRTALAGALHAVAKEDLRLALVLPAEAVLRRPLWLPAAARTSLKAVAGYEMDRQTPFRAEQVHYAVRERGPAADGRLAVELVVVPRSTLAPWLAQVPGWGVAVDAVDVAEGFGRLGVNLLPAEQAPRRTHPRRRWNVGLAAASVVLGFLVLGQWVHNRGEALAAMQDDVDQLKRSAAPVAALRQKLEDNAGAAGFLAQRKATQAPVLAVLQELTERLPDDTFLERFTRDGSGKVSFQGQSPQAARLVDTLKGATWLGEPSFQGTIQKDPGTGKERFFMSAQVKAPAGADARDSHGGGDGRANRDRAAPAGAASEARR